ncbi:MAG TPA: methyltransferase domain-containing protein [Gemmataceae bacterium]|jgi:phosphatidylethanolamine/phosphatidyl-N-methylethanolamine N-methyltransferase|nr:methyltransferase domain-containing protein [Gemmataceae bacterium]
MKDALLFFGQTFRRWRTIGAIAPSGAVLARTIARAAGEVADGQVVLELGPGTGVITRELVRHFPQARIVAVEVIDAFATRLAEMFPGVTVVRGCASRLDAHLGGLGIAPENVAAVISGLPLLSLPGDLPQQILASVTGVLRPGRRYVQFTYSASAWRRFATPGLRPLARQKVWRNFPPATVLSFEREG